MSTEQISQVFFMALGAILSLSGGLVTTVIADRIEQRRRREAWAREDRLRKEGWDREDWLRKEAWAREDKLRQTAEERKAEEEAKSHTEGAQLSAFFWLPGVPLAAIFWLVSDRVFQWIESTPWEVLVLTIVIVVGFFLFQALGSGLGRALLPPTFLISLYLILLVSFVKLVQSYASSQVMAFWQGLFAVGMATLLVGFWYVYLRKRS